MFYIKGLDKTEIGKGLSNSSAKLNTQLTSAARRKEGARNVLQSPALHEMILNFSPNTVLILGSRPGSMLEMV